MTKASSCHPQGQGLISHQIWSRSPNLTISTIFFLPLREPQVPSPHSSQPCPRCRRLQSQAAPGALQAPSTPRCRGAGLPVDRTGPDPAPHSPQLPSPFPRSPALSSSHIANPVAAPGPADPPQHPVSLLCSITSHHPLTLCMAQKNLIFILAFPVHLSAGTPETALPTQAPRN